MVVNSRAFAFSPRFDLFPLFGAILGRFLSALFDQHGRFSPSRSAQRACCTARSRSARRALRMQQNALREPESLRGVRRSSVRRDTDAAEPMCPRVRSDADALRRVHACRAAGVAALKRTSATRMLSEECTPAQQASFRAKLRFDAAEPRALDGPSLARRRAPSPPIPSPIYGIICEFSDFWAQFWTIFKSTRPPSKS